MKIEYVPICSQLIPLELVITTVDQHTWAKAQLALSPVKEWNNFFLEFRSIIKSLSGRYVATLMSISNGNVKIEGDILDGFQTMPNDHKGIG